MKPVDFEKFAEVVKTIENFWFAVVTLPRVDDMATETPLDVLLVEDSPTDVLLTEEALSEASRFRLQSSERLAEALRLLSEAHFDVVLLDLGLPDSQGIDTLRRLRAKNPQVAVVVLTGKDDEELALRALQEGAEDYLVKGQADAGQLQPVDPVRPGAEVSREKAAGERGAVPGVDRQYPTSAVDDRRQGGQGAVRQPGLRVDVGSLVPESSRRPPILHGGHPPSGSGEDDP